jgi:hypothetical protein
VLTTKEGHSIKWFGIPQDVSSRDLTLTLADEPVLDADSFPGMRIGPPSGIASSEDPRRDRLQILVDRNAAVDRQTSLPGDG